ncbi:FecR family protein [Halobacteriovorax sp. GB3]|uniref:FecR family protein n=1 Tax=Halobacteriovorax sp. GB3 TaxID=2719615 RepID=UPI002362C64B|nr:FecR family protein [Halobacteriovorax sp. GB3]MDD0853127.1 FecR family protein [Halobacteriovorax sp. GB3]
MNVKNKLVFTSILFLFSISSHALMYAKVLKVRGTVTKLLPGAIRANTVKVGDRLPEDTSIVTGSKSFVRISFENKSTVSLGPSSKLVVASVKANSPSVISLLKGQIRSKVEKDKSKNINKLFIKTKTAALGVRGTDFQTVFNPQNNVTSLLTYEGKVAMVKVDKKTEALRYEKAREEKEVSREKGQGPKLESKKQYKKELLEDSPEHLEKALSTEKVVEVQKGQFSGVSQTLTRASEPVKISPVQFTVLYKNTGLREKGELKAKVVSLSEKDKSKTIAQADQTAPPEGYYDEQSGKYAPKSGGLLDLSSGLYIPPAKDAPFDPKNKVYVPTKEGRIDVVTGEYVAPKGLKLDPVAGFLPMVEGDDKLLAMSEGLNESSAMELWKPKKNEEELHMLSLLSLREAISHQAIKLTYFGFEYELTNSGSSNSSNFQNREGGQKGMFLDYYHKSDGTWQLTNELGFRKVDINKDQSGFSQDSRTLVTMGIGLRRYLTSRYLVVSKLSLEQEFFYSVDDSQGFDENKYKRITLFKWRNYITGEIVKWNRFALTGLAGLLLIPEKESGDFTTDMTFGLNLEFGIRYWSSRMSHFDFNIASENYEQDIESDNLNSTQKHATNGLKLSYTRLF